MSKEQTIDKPWFIQQLHTNKQSVRGLARHLDVDASAVSRMLSGQRKMKMDEANAIAHFLRAPVSEVLKHAGVSIDIDGMPTRILLASIINDKGHLDRLKEPKPLPQSVIDRAQAAIIGAGNGKIIAAQIRAVQGPLSILDDAVVLFAHTDDVDASAIGGLAICRTNDGEQIMARIERARKTGEARIYSVSGKAIEVTLQTATAVLAIIP
ncbi:helix-turn-helix domain-containing protein [Phyllobacterium sp. 628]|uniref:helix-turn-helix domain-containing protein n=1 Tax=Phyllobacterium sp. 628 TaxID=2718938 RepID=UPI0016627CAD|nr:helix-turn-helix transcriptional regulator [Phyllobacterium sp. 628]QND53443.1 helix-turn-helix domain-containing protein [Phyllobacterium sp. 628]